jgi:hypothetical protein
MFLRRICRQKDGKSHHYWVLVESYRTARGPRQRQIAYLGEMDAAGRLGVQQAAQNHPGHQTSLLENNTAVEWIEINVNAVRTERSRRFGDVWLALELITKLQLDRFFQEAFASTRPKISWAPLAARFWWRRVFVNPKANSISPSIFIVRRRWPICSAFPRTQFMIIVSIGLWTKCWRKRSHYKNI